MPVEFSKLKEANLIIDEIYCGGSVSNIGAEVLSKLTGC